MMSNLNFLNQLMTFPKDTITEEIVELMQPYMSMEDYKYVSITVRKLSNIQAFF